MDLVDLEIHFNTRTVVRDILRLVDEGARHDEARCELRNLKVGFLPRVVHEEDIETIAMGLHIIFPRLMNISSLDSRWCAVEDGLADRRRRYR